MRYRYAFKSDKENIIKVVGRDLGISTKQAVELCSFIKGMEVKKARELLEKVIQKKAAIPFRRFTEGAGHKKGMSSAKYPLNTSEHFLGLLKALEANAQNKGLSSELKIVHACAQKAPRQFHYGRKRRIKMKRTHVEIAAEEIEVKKEKETKKEKRAEKNQPRKIESKEKVEESK